MTLDEAIGHFEELSNGRDERVMDYAQISGWLRELRSLRESYQASVKQMEIARGALKAAMGGEIDMGYEEFLSCSMFTYYLISRAHEKENAELRDLVDDMYGYYVTGKLNTCDFCDQYCCEGNAPVTCKADTPDGMVVDSIERRMRDLGIEAMDE